MTRGLRVELNFAAYGMDLSLAFSYLSGKGTGTCMRRRW